jgi:hypothetical protein
MKPFQPVSLLLVLLFLFTHNISAQKKQIGIDVGFGKTQMSPYYNIHTYPYKGPSNGFEDYLRIGLSYQYTPKKIFSIKTGLYIEDRGNDNHIRYIKVPVGIDFSVGSILFQFDFGGGFYYGSLISHTGPMFGYYAPKKNNYGGYCNLGIAIQLSPKVNLNIGYQQDFDFIPFYIDHGGPPGGNKWTDLYRGFDSFFNISMKFMLIKE